MTLRCRENKPGTPFSRLGRMAHSPRPLLALALAATAALALIACGGEDAKLLPGETAREITANLDTVQQLSDEGDCVGAESAAQQVGEQIEALEGVDPKLKRALEAGAVRLEEVIARCEESSSEAIAPATIPPESEEEDEKAPKESEDKEEKEKDGEDDEPKPQEKEAPDTPSTSPGPPPHAEGKGEGPPAGNAPPSEEEGAESPSGGVSPGSPAGGGE